MEARPDDGREKINVRGETIMASGFRTGVVVASLLAASAGLAQQPARTEPFSRDLAIETRLLTRELVEETIREAITLNAQPVIQQLS